MEERYFSLLDDASPIVRKSIAEALASAVDAPHAIVLALANDQSAISSIVLGRSPVLPDAELIDCAAVADASFGARVNDAVLRVLRAKASRGLITCA